MREIWDFGFDSQTCQVGHSVVISLLSLRRFFGAVLLWCNATEMSPATRYTLRRNNASIVKIRFLIFFYFLQMWCGHKICGGSNIPDELPCPHSHYCLSLSLSECFSYNCHARSVCWKNNSPYPEDQSNIQDDISSQCLPHSHSTKNCELMSVFFHLEEMDSVRKLFNLSMILALLFCSK